MTTIDWNALMQSAGTALEPLPNGPYDVQITSAEPKMTSNQKLMFSVRMQVLGGPHAGRPVYNQFVVSPENPQAMGFFFQHMNALGLDRSFFAQNPPPEAVAQALVNRTCRVTLSQRTWNGQLRNNVDKIEASQMAGVAGPGPQAGPVGMPGVPQMPGAPQMPQQPGFPQPQMPGFPQPQMPTPAPAPQPQQPGFPQPQPQPQPQPTFPAIPQPAPQPPLPQPAVQQPPAQVGADWVTGQQPQPQPQPQPQMPGFPQQPQAPAPQPQPVAPQMPQMPGAPQPGVVDPGTAVQQPPQPQPAPAPPQPQMPQLPGAPATY